MMVGAGGHHGAKLEEDIGCHGVDPEHEGSECVKSEVTNDDTTKSTIWEQACVQKHVEIVAKKTEIGNEIIEYKTNGNLSKQRPV